MGQCKDGDGKNKDRKYIFEKDLKALQFKTFEVTP